MKNKLNILAISLFLSTLSCCGATQNNGKEEESSEIDNGKSVYYWDDGMCEYKGFFDSTQISREHLNNIKSLVDAAGSLLIRTGPAHHKTVEHTDSDIDILQKEYDSLFNYFNKMLLPDAAPLDSLRKVLLNNLTMIYKGYLAMYKAILYDDYQPILDLSKTDTTVDYYAQALATGGDKMLEAWERLTAEMAKQNVSPERIWQRFYEEKGTSNWEMYAKKRLIHFGWWNNYNRTIPKLRYPTLSNEYFHNN